MSHDPSEIILICWFAAEEKQYLINLMHPLLNYKILKVFIKINKKRSHFILGGHDYCVLTFKLIIWCNALIVYIHVFYIVLIFENTCMQYICNYIYKYTVDPPLNLPIPPNMSLTLPVSHFNSSKKCFAIQYEHNKYIVLIFDVSS